MTARQTPILIMLGSSTVDSDACTGTAFPINRHDPEYVPFPPRRLMQSLRIALDRQPRATTNCLPSVRADPAPTSTTNEPLPLSP
jgi:hypothetical protein